MFSKEVMGAFTEGAKEIERLRNALREIEALGQGMDDWAIENVAGVESGIIRAKMYIEARKIAKKALIPPFIP
jgi:hypothetical protein